MEIAQLVSFLAKMSARDQANKAVQYGARLLAYVYTEAGNKDSAAKCKSLAATVSAGRNLFRFGNTINYYQKLSKALQSPITTRSTVTFGNDLFMSLYYLCDSIVFLCRAKVYNGNMEELQKRSFRMWTTGLLFALLDKVLEAVKLIKEKNALYEKSPVATREARAVIETKLAALRKNAFKDVLNFLVAFDGSKLPVPFKMNEGFVCSCGLLAALLSVQTLWSDSAPAKASATPKVAP